MLVTGATGFIGAAVARALRGAGERVRVLVRDRPDATDAPRADLAALDVEPVPGDLQSPASLAAAVEGCRGVFHVAADYRLWTPDPDAMYRTNVEGTRALLDAAMDAGVERFVHTSSVATLGLFPDGSPADEATPSRLEDMIGPYKRSKYLAEQAVAAAVAERGARAVIVNPSAPVGPGDVRPTPTGRILLDAARGRMPAYVDTGLNIVHVDDVADGHLRAFERGVDGRRYILGGENMALRELLAMVAAACGRRPPRVRLTPGVVMPIAWACEAFAAVTGRPPAVPVDGVRMARKHMYFRSDRARAELGYAPRAAERAVHDALEWFRAAGYLDGDGRPGARGRSEAR
jgi:dihydroflavonol-4-reductase